MGRRVESIEHDVLSDAWLHLVPDRALMMAGSSPGRFRKRSHTTGVSVSFRNTPWESGLLSRSPPPENEARTKCLSDLPVRDGGR